MSPDMDKGIRWGPEITDQLEDSKIGIICLTQENLNQKWIIFEAGALSKTKDAHVCTFLLDLKPIDIELPLAQFQHTRFEKNDVRKLVHTINQTVKKSGKPSLSDPNLNELFEILWPHLEKELREIAEQQPDTEAPFRKDREILEEILSLLRGRERKEPEKIEMKTIELIEIIFEQREEIETRDREIERLHEDIQFLSKLTKLDKEHINQIREISELKEKDT
jgi:hypothetical protein